MLRTPRTVHLSIKVNGQVRRLADIVEAWLAGERAPVELTTDAFRTQRHLVFAVASIAAHRLGRWGRAHRFAQLALSAAPSPAAGSEEGPAAALDFESVQFHELRFLRALTCRMQIGARGPADLSGDDVWGTALDEGLEQLVEFDRYHLRLGNDSDVVRSYAERAALKGFYASWWAILHRKLPTTPAARKSSRGYSRIRAVREFMSLNRDLSTALTLIAGDKGSTLLESAHVQVFANVAASYALTTLCPDFPAEDFRATLGKERVDQAVSWWAHALESRAFKPSLDLLPPVVRSQLHIFLLDHGVHSAPLHQSSGAPPSLELDSELGDLLRVEVEQRLQAAQRG